MEFSLIIIGDEILHGTRIDKHFAFFKSALESRGLQLAKVQYLPDDTQMLVTELKRSFEDGLPTFVTGGIGGTPDDHTRQATAAALGLPLTRHTEAQRLIEEVSLKRGDALDSAPHQQRLNMADFPTGADIVPNPYNNIAGFSFQEHYFLPGFPVMAHPMTEWILDHLYADRFHQVEQQQRSTLIFELPESHIAGLMRHLESQYPGIKTFSLPTVRKTDTEGQVIAAHIEFGVKATGEACTQIETAWNEAQAALLSLGGRLQAL